MTIFGWTSIFGMAMTEPCMRGFCTPDRAGTARGHADCEW